MRTAPENKISPFRLRLAERNIEVTALYSRVAEMCRDYLAEFEEPDISVRITPENIAYERIQSAETDKREGRKPSPGGDRYLETLAVYRQIAEGMIDYDTLLFHGAAVAVGERCFLFLAKSGTGKTTHLRNWLKVVPGAFVVNGDKPLINAEKKLVYGTPWCGKENLNTNTAVPLSGLVILERGEENNIRRIPFGELFPTLLQQCYRPSEQTAFVKTVRLLGKMKDIPCYRLKCNMDASSALVAYEGMN